MKITLYTANCIGNARNCIYPNEVTVTDQKSFEKAVSSDYVCAKYKRNYRSNENFIQSDCIMQDCDNTHSENSKDWITPERIAEVFQDIPYVLHFSKSHNKVKHDKPARPRFHVGFQSKVIKSAKEHSDLKKRLLTFFPYFDSKAQDAARFFFGTSPAEVIIHDGTLTIDDFLDEMDFANWENSLSEIHEGNRNSEMSHIAGKLIKRYGGGDETLKKFVAHAEKCNPPLPDEELKSIWNSAVRFGLKVAAQEGYISPEHYNENFKYKPENSSDVDQARVFSREYIEKIGYTPSTDYLVYNGSIWEESKEMAQGLSQELTDKQLAEAKAEIAKQEKAMSEIGAMELLASLGEKKALLTFNDEQLRAYHRYDKALGYAKYALRRRDSKEIANTLKEAKPMLLLPHSILDSDEFLLNTPKCTIQLQKGTTKEHEALDYITRQTTVDPSDDGMDLWLDALDTIFQNDKELIEYVQRIVGLSAIGKVYVEALIISYGNGSNGKSTFWNAIARVLGTYSGTISADVLTVGCKRNVKPELAEAKGKRLLIAAEMEESVRLNTSNVKQLCSTDQISAEKKYKDPFHYTPSHTLVLYTNHLPKVGAIDNGTWRRLIVIPFDAKIKGSIKNYGDYLFDNAGGAILKWIVEGARRVIAENYVLKLPNKVQEAIDSYKENNDWFSRFLEECCEIENSYTEKSGPMYAAYRAYCVRIGEYIRSTTDFYTILEQEGFVRRKTNKGTIVQGLKLKSEFAE